MRACESIVHDVRKSTEARGGRARRLGMLKLRLLLVIAAADVAIAAASASAQRGKPYPRASAPPNFNSACPPPSAAGAGICGQVSGGGGAPPGVSFYVHGTCVEVLDAAHHTAVTQGQCDRYGRFAVALAPGRYIVRAGGYNRTVEVKAGQWRALDFFMPVP